MALVGKPSPCGHERSPTLFSPTSFPCEAWIVAPSSNVRPVIVEGASYCYGGCFKTDSGILTSGELFPSREEAIQEACRKLALAQERHRKAGLNLARRAAAVERLVKGTEA